MVASPKWAPTRREGNVRLIEGIVPDLHSVPTRPVDSGGGPVRQCGWPLRMLNFFCKTGFEARDTVGGTSASTCGESKR